MTKYKHTSDDAQQFNKYGVDLTVYGEGVESANVVHVSVDEGHFEEFMDVEAHYIYYIIEGSGVFVLDDKKVEAKATDLIVIPPKTRIHYFGKMKMTLVVSPAYKEENQRHIRDVSKDENPLEEVK